MKSDSAKNILQQYSGNDLGEIESSSLEQWMLDEEGFDIKSEAMQSVWDTIPKDARIDGLRNSKSVLSEAKIALSPFFLRQRLWLRLSSPLLFYIRDLRTRKLSVWFLRGMGKVILPCRTGPSFG